MELVCDNSELGGIWGAEAPDILVIGGYAIPRANTVGLLNRVEAFKAKHGLALQLRVLTDSESIGNHDSKIVGACGVD
jgi:hypothetical protein